MRLSKGENVFKTVNYIVLILIACSSLFPLLHLIALSISDSTAIETGKVSLWPAGFNMDTYSLLFNGTPIVKSFSNSVVLTVVGVAFCMIVTTFAAYPLSRPHFYARRFFTLAMIFTMIFSGGIIPTYLVIQSLGLVNSYWALWLPALVSTYNMLLLRTYFENIPSEIDEAARMDGCSETRLLLQIVLPVSMPVLATLSLFYGVAFWNIFLSMLIYINDTDKQNLTVLVQKMIQSQSVLQQSVTVQPDDQVHVVEEGIKAAGVIVLIAPMLIVYPFVQRYFVKGVMLGSVKG
ncbi:ABC transporter permease [Paenibacillus baekrokdamisoli]|uniref:ABC transporter permease n=1 Tax=Paenibacillus baekrokdamisoli TaxID=1712516 RepID=A0A3G9J640_9BACL|nr:carbohydrate ABC transporter permease [Paenibacillus baekrokdamisoli]MBB3071978.1 putative aldouronate transport system permease protein [Paenibacillus baekrokdamisoli]BBH20283.1 ABC transporter permease [Paenibacillus baekrokdamisoli]